MNQDILETILQCPNLPTLPAVAVRIIEMTQRPDVSLDELARTIQNDQALSAKIVRTVNSSFYGVRKRCSSVNQALVMLGLSAVKSLALGFSIVTTMAPGEDDGFDYTGYWRRGLFTGVAARLIAASRQKGFEDEVFLGGLLQDVGMIAMRHGLGERYLKVLAQTGGDHRQLVQRELAEFELQHPDVGAMLVQRWRFPDELITPVKYHERPTAAPPEHAELIRCVALGNIAHDVLTDKNPADAMARFVERCAQWFAIDQAGAEDLLRRIADNTRELSSLFKLDIGAAADAERAMTLALAPSDAPGVPSNGPGAYGETLNTLLTDSDEADALTGTCGRAAMLRKAHECFESAQASHGPFAVVQIAIDSFAKTVGSLGQDAGDAVLVETATLLREHFAAKGGLVCRWDSAVFTLILPGADRAEAVRAAAEIRLMINAASKDWTLEQGGDSLTSTVAVGVAAIDPASAAAFTKVQQLVAAAVGATEAALHAGGNCVRAFTPRAAA